MSSQISRWYLPFKISRDFGPGTGREPRLVDGITGQQPNRSQGSNAPRFQWLIETALIALAFSLYAGSPAPNVNESHYLTKATHFWNPQWCAGDLFLGSSFSHWFFYAVLGWPTKFLTLTQYAWFGRILTWVLLAFAWQRLSFAVVPFRFMSVLSAMFFLLLNDRFHMAGEWVVGGFEAKGIAYFFVVLALSFVVKGRWKYVWPLLGAASAFHVLVGGWSVLACFYCCAAGWIRRGNERSMDPGFWKARLKENLIGLTLGGLLALPGIIPPILADLGTRRETILHAHNIYVSHRISHHLDFGAFPVWHVARFALMVAVWAVLYKWLRDRLLQNPIIFHRKLEPIRDFAAGALVISFAGLVLSGGAELGKQFPVSLLRFYWFRLADFAIPVSVSLGCCFVIVFWLERERDLLRRCSCMLFVVCILLASVLMIRDKHRVAIPNADLRSLPQYPGSPERFYQSWQNWKKMCHWVSENTAADAVFITPDQQQTFKWYAGRIEVVAWKDIPQDAQSIVEWDRRLIELNDIQKAADLELFQYSDEKLAEFAQEYVADYMIVPQRVYDLAAADPSFDRSTYEQVYPAPGVKSTWVVLKF